MKPVCKKRKSVQRKFEQTACIQKNNKDRKHCASDPLRFLLVFVEVRRNQRGDIFYRDIQRHSQLTEQNLFCLPAIAFIHHAQTAILRFCLSAFFLNGQN